MPNSILEPKIKPPVTTLEYLSRCIDQEIAMRKGRVKKTMTEGCNPMKKPIIQPLTEKLRTEIQKPEVDKKIQRIPLAVSWGLFMILTSCMLVTYGTHILIQTGVPEKLIVQGFGVMFIICGFVCARDLIPGMRRIMRVVK